MVGLFENLRRIKTRKEKVSPVEPFLSVSAQKHRSSESGISNYYGNWGQELGSGIINKLFV